MLHSLRDRMADLFLSVRITAVRSIVNRSGKNTQKKSNNFFHYICVPDDPVHWLLRTRKIPELKQDELDFT